MVNIRKLNKALAFVKNKEFEAAEKIYSELLRESPNSDVVLSFWGMFNLKKGLLSKAEKILESAYKIKKSPSTIASLAYTKYKLKKFDDSIIFYEELFRYDKDSEHIYQKIIECFRMLKMFNFASAYCQKYIKAHPESPHAMFLITQNYFDLGEYKKAEDACARAIEKCPENPSNWINAGFLQELLYNNEELAQECYLKAIEGKDIQAYYHLAVSLQKAGKLEQAEENYKKALSIYPDDNDIKSALACLYLSQRKFEQGAKLFCEATTCISIEDFSQFCNQDKTVLVTTEGGFGDSIQFARYLPYLEDKFKKVKVYIRTPLMTLLKRSFPSIEFYDSNVEHIEYDISIPIMGLPYYLGLDFDHIPAKDGFLVVDEIKVDDFKTRYFNTAKPKIGLCWKAGDMNIRAAINRTINIDYLKPLLELKNVEFYSFQIGDIFDGIKKYPQIINIAQELKTFDDTAAAMKNLDALISVDSACIHIAGGLGIDSKLLIPYCSDWRWFDNTKNTEWYSSIDIIKQQERQDWYKEIDILTEYIKRF